MRESRPQGGWRQQLPFSTTLWPNDDEWLAVFRMKPGVEAVDEALDIDCFYDWKLAVDVRKIINRQRFFYLFKNFTRSYKNSDRTKCRTVADKMVWTK